MKISLNGKWNFIEDPGDKLDFKKVQDILSGKKKLKSMSLPVNWELAGLNNFNGSVWFIKNFSLALDPAPALDHALTLDLTLTPNRTLTRTLTRTRNPNRTSNRHVQILKFLGVDYFADVWLNEAYLGHHEGYFQIFSFNINDQLRENGKNLLVVKVNSPFEQPGKVWPEKKKLIKGIFNHHDCRPGGTNPKYGQDQNTGGIWNDVILEFGFPISIKNIKVASSLNKDKSSARLSFNIEYFSIQSVRNDLEVDIQTPSSKKINKSIKLKFSRGAGKVNFSLDIKNPELWWSWDIGNPNLYKIRLSSEYFEGHELLFGIREVKLDDNQQFYLNGKKLFLRGTNIIPTQFLSDLNKNKISKMVSLIKEANINIVRVHAHVNRKEFYEEFNKQGILLWQDFSLQWTYDESKEFEENAQSQIKDMVNLLYNYCSIAFWCCHNEPGNQINSLDKMLYKSVFQKDKSRIIRTASNYEEHAYEGWYWGIKENYAAAPMGPLVTEFGAQALPALTSLKKFIPHDKIFPPHWKTWQYHDFQVDQTFNIAKVEMGKSINSFIRNSQKYQADVIETAVNFYRRKRFNGINGIFQFMFIDCWQSITWSVVDYYGKKKFGYDVLKKVYQPVFLSVNLWQETYYKDKKILFSLHIINDLHQKFHNCILVISLDKKSAMKISKININENDMIFMDQPKFQINLPKNIRYGKHSIKLELKHKDIVISQTDFQIEIVRMPA